MLPMKKFSLLLFALLAFTLAADSLRYDEELFNAVNTKNRNDKALQLIDIASKFGNNTRTPLLLLHKENSEAPFPESVIKKYDKLWKLRPYDIHVVCTGISLYVNAGVDAGRILELFSLTENYGSDLNPDEAAASKPVIDSIKSMRLTLHNDVGINSGGLEYLQKINADDFLFPDALAFFCSNAAYRAKLLGNDALAKKLTAKLQVFAAKHAAKFEDAPEDVLLDEMKTAYSNANAKSGTELFKLYLKRFPGGSKRLVACGIFVSGATDFKTAAGLLETIKFVDPLMKEHMLWRLAINTGNRTVAKQLCEKFSGQEKQDAVSEYSLRFKEPAELLKMGNDSKYPDDVRALCKMAYAIECGNVNSYREGRALFKDKNLSANDINTIAYTAAKLGVDLDEAEKMLRDVVKKYPHNPAFLDSLGYLCYRKRLYAEAEKYTLLALEKIRSDIPAEEILTHLADIRLARGDFYNARKIFRRALELCSDLESSDAKYIKKKLQELE